MYDAFIAVLTVAYAAGGVVTFIGFIPTMVDLWHKKCSANLATYGIWTVTTLLAFLYGLFVLHNLVFNLVVGLQLLASLAVLILRLRIPSSYC